MKILTEDFHPFDFQKKSIERQLLIMSRKYERSNTSHIVPKLLECNRVKPNYYRENSIGSGFGIGIGNNIIMEELQNGTELRMNENQVRERLKLKDQPEDVRTISLPGKCYII